MDGLNIADADKMVALSAAFESEVSAMERLAQLTERDRLSLRVANLFLSDFTSPNQGPIAIARRIGARLTEREMLAILKREDTEQEIRSQMKVGALNFARVAEHVGGVSESFARYVFANDMRQRPPRASMTSDLQIAIPKEGRAIEMVKILFGVAGFEIVKEHDDHGLLCDARGKLANIPVYYLRTEAVLTWMNSGAVDVACYGNDKLANILAEQRLNGAPSAKLEVFSRIVTDPRPDNRIRLSFAVPEEQYNEANRLGYRYVEGKKIATTYDHFVREWLRQHNIKAEVVPIPGGVEKSIRELKDMGIEVIADIVQSGRSLRNNGLIEFNGAILPGEVNIFGFKEPGLSPEKRSLVRQIGSRLREANLLVAAA